ncbi:MAG: hypothetical protein GC191_03960 [Azospirillum sp.]|nr:hypothetical protein [Azospirillum sp.]
MKRFVPAFGTAALLAIVLAAGPLQPAPALAGCEYGEKIDGSTADQAKRKFEAAGFRQVHELHKGCDNYWHGIATKDGVVTRVVLSPEGEVMREGD